MPSSIASASGLVILHLSDLHFGNKNRFQGRDLSAFGTQFSQAIGVAREELGWERPVDFLVVSGDIAEMAKPKEFEDGYTFLTSLLQGLDLPVERTIFVSGNHDLSWSECKKVDADRETYEFNDAQYQERLNAVKFQFYNDFVTKFYGQPVSQLSNRVELDKTCGACIYDFVVDELPISFAALNTSEQETHQMHGGELGNVQAEALMTEWTQSKYASYLKVIVVHHNPVATPSENLQWTEEWILGKIAANNLDVTPDWLKHYTADMVGFKGADRLRRITRDTNVHLLLHGHHHNPTFPDLWGRREGHHAPILSVGSFGLSAEQIPTDQPLTCQLIYLQRKPEPRMTAYPLEFNPNYRLAGTLDKGQFQLDSKSESNYDDTLPLPSGWQFAENENRVTDGEQGLPIIDQSSPSTEGANSHIISVAQNNADEIAAQSQLDIVRDFINVGQFAMAQPILQRLRLEKWSRVSGELRGKIANNQGAIELGAGNLNAAHTFFEEAYAYRPSLSAIESNLAQVYLLQEDYESALRYSQTALEHDPYNENAASAYIQALYHLSGFVAVTEWMEATEQQWTKVSPSCMAALAMIALKENDYSLCEASSKASLEREQNATRDPQVYVLLASSIICPLQDRWNAEHKLPDDLSTNEKQRLEEAEEAYSQAIHIYTQNNNPLPLHQALVSRAGIRLLLKKLQEGLHDCDRVLSVNGGQLGALENKGRILLRMRRHEEAITPLELLLQSWLKNNKAANTQPHPMNSSRRLHEVEILLASAYLNAGYPEKVVNLLCPLGIEHFGDANQDEDAFNTIGKAEMLLATAQNLPEDQKRAIEEKVLRHLSENFANSSDAKCVLAFFYSNHENEDNALALLREAYTLAPEQEKPRYTCRIAQSLSRQEKFPEAVEQYRIFLSERSDYEMLPEYVNCLYHAKMYDDALKTIQEIRVNGTVPPQLLEMEADILEDAGDVESAQQAWQNLIAQHPKAISYQIRLAFLEHRLGNFGEVRRIVQAISFQSVRNNAAHLMNIAKLRQLTRLHEVFRYAYQARRVAFGDAEIHVHYMMLCFNMDADSEDDTNALRQRETISIGNAIKVKSDGIPVTFILEDEQPVYSERGEIATVDARTELFLGKKRGDGVVVTTERFQPVEYEIVDIQSKYLYASHETTEMLRDGRLQHHALQVFHSPDDQFEERFWRFIEQSSRNDSKPVEMYERGITSFNTYAQLIGRSVPEMWLHITDGIGTRFNAYDGTDAEQAKQKRIYSIVEDKPIILELTAILTILYLGLEAELRQRFPNIVVPRHLLDRIDHYIYEMRTRGSAPARAATVHGQRYFIETPEDEINRKRHLLSRLHSFVNSLQIEPVLSILSANENEKNVYGEMALASILLTKEREGILLSDDLPLCQQAAEYWQVLGVSTQALLQNLLDRQIITKETRYQALAKLALANYSFVSFDAEGVIWNLEQHLFQINKEILAILKTFHGPTSTEDIAISIMAEVLKNCWTRRLLDHQKSFVLAAVLSALLTGRETNSVVTKLLQVLRRKLYLVEHIFDEIREAIRVEVRVRS